MKIITSLLVSIMVFIFFVNEAKAIIIIPAIILIPIVKLVAIIISGFSLPVIGVTAYFHKISNKSVVKGIFIGVGILVIIAVLTAIILKLINPSRPLF